MDEEKLPAKKRDRIIDGVIRVLKIIGKSDLFFGIFMIAWGLSFIFVRWLFPVFIVLSIMIAFNFAIEWFVNVLRGDYTVWNIIQRVLAVAIIVALLIFCGFLIFNHEFNVLYDRIIVCATTVADGLKNLIRTMRVVRGRNLKRILIVLSALCILYGIIYGILSSEGAGETFTMTIHGFVFIFCGFIDISIFLCERKNAKALGLPIGK